jgi:malate synthase
VNATALAKVRDDKTRESADGFDGSWVAHPTWSRCARSL